MEHIIFKDCEEIFQKNIAWKKLYGKTILISGAYGMLASYMVHMLIYLNEYHNADIKIIALVRSEEKCKRCFGYFANRPYFVISTQPIETPLIIRDKIDFIIHAASLASPQHYSVRPIDVLLPNSVGTYNLLKLGADKNIEGFLFFSTGDIYGKIEGIEKINENNYGILDPLDMHSCYGESKRMAETMCKAFWIQRHVPAKIVRIWHTYAPTMDYKNDPRVFASFVNDIVNHRDIVMKSDGLAKRSFCYISDAVAGYFLVLLNGKFAEAYNVCNSKEWYSIAELAEIVTQIRPDLGLKVIQKERKETDVYLENTSANFVPPCSEKLEQLGWSASVSVEEGFERVLRYCENGM